MDWLNYHHLLYFWTVAREGGLSPAARMLSVSPSAISAQLRLLEESLGEKLFRKRGRTRSLTETGELVFSYAEEIFNTGRELQNVLKGTTLGRLPRLVIGAADSFPKLVTRFLLRPLDIESCGEVHLVCREGKLPDLISQLATYRMDIVFADEPPPSPTSIRAHVVELGASPVAFCAAGPLGRRLGRNFPHGLHGSPALLPSENTPLRRELDFWFNSLGVRPRIVGEFEDASLMKIMATDGRAFTVVPAIIAEEAWSRYQLRSFGLTEECSYRFHAITAERKVSNTHVNLIARSARQSLDFAIAGAESPTGRKTAGKTRRAP